MKTFNLFNGSVVAGSGPNQTNETQSRHNRVGRITYLCHTFTVLLTFLILGTGQVWGEITFSGGYVYFDNTNTNWSSSDVIELVAHQYTSYDYIGATTMSKISGTNNLYYCANPQGSGWGSIWGWRFMHNGSAWGNGNTSDAYIQSNSGGYTATTNYGLNSGSYYLSYGASSSNGCALTTSYLGNSSSYSELNYTQTIYQCVAENGGTPAKSTASIATISISTKYLSSANGTDNHNVSISSGNNSCNTTAARTATVTMTATSIADGYTFLGWYDSETGGTQLQSSTTYTYQATAAKNVYARFSHETTHSVDITYKCGATVVSTATSQAIGQVTASSITAPTVAGYTFSGWTLGSGISNQSVNTSANPISVKTLSSGTYTMQANYTEDLSSPYIVCGGNKIVTTGETWRTSADVNNKMLKKTGHSTESVAYFNVSVTALNQGSANSDYQFKIYNTSGGTFYGLTGTTQYYLNRTESGTAKSLSNPGINIELRADVTGTYEIKVDYSTPASPTVTVTYPTAYTVTFGAGTINGSSTAITATATPSFSSGDYVLKTTAITFAKGSTNPGYDWKGWYSNNDGTGTLHSSTDGSWTSAANTRTDNISVYACYTYHQYTITYKDQGNTAFTGTHATGYPTKHTYNTATTLKTASKTGYTFGGWFANSACTGGAVTSIAALSTRDTTLYAKWTANNYTITLNNHDATSAGTENVSVTFDATTGLTSRVTPPEKTGYTFGGYYTSEGGEGTQLIEDDGDWITNNAYISSAGKWVNAGDVTLHAKWTANNYTVTLDVDEANKGTIDGADESASVTYDAAPSTIANLPTAANGYKLDGYYTDQLGEGVKVINGAGTWIASVTGYTDEDKKWVHAGDVTLYAYYKKAQITELEISNAVVAPSTTGITVTPTIEPEPEGTVEVCYEIQYSNGTALSPQPSMSVTSNVLTFTAPAASATYRIEAKLCLDDGADGCSGTLLHTATTTFQVAGEHTVTVRYQDADGRTLAASTEVTARPLEWTTAGAITPPTITGYTFARWDAGDGVSIKNGDSDPVTTTTTTSIQIQAVYDGTLTAVYNKKNMIFFNNTLGWEDVYVYFYTSDKYWDNSYGTGAYKGKEFDYNKQFWDMHYGHMTQIEGTDIWYFDYTAQGWDGWSNIAFASMDKANSGTDNTSDNAKAFFSNTTSDPIQVVRRGDHKTSLPMFVPLSGQTGVKRNENRAVYYSEGYWMNYPENTGYVLHVYDGTTYGASDQMQEIPFEFNEDKTLPMSIKVELNAGRTYGFEIHRADGTVLGEDSYTMQSGNSGDVGQTTKTLGESKRSKITTAVAGDYIFTLNFGNSGGYKYFIGVHYPVASGDYRVLYTDDAAWSQGTHSGNYSWWHESRTIHKENGASDIVSFYVKADEDTKMKFQYVSGINASTGAVTWTDVASGSIDLSSIEEDGVYNFHLTQSAGAISVETIEPYTGKYYIRTDCAGATKWENFRTTDHEMTYSDYTETNHGYSHYYPHWVGAGSNVKFCIANDYSSCISDTLIQDYGTVIADITAAGALQNYGANIRFMWNQATNKISRAYIGGSADIRDRFLVLEGDEKMFDENGNALTGVYQDHNKEGDVYLGVDNQVVLHDDENFVYERTIKVQTTARAKLTAKYNNNIQYFVGDEDETVELLGGSGGDTKHKMRIVYDFKTNRLVTAYVPEGEIEDEIAIHADIMLVREHQNAGEQLTFKGDGALSDVKTVYGVMRFNRYTLNNKETTGGHSPVGDPKSAYERGLYWISFPFDVNLSDVFGFGTYGTHWIIMQYRGDLRATNGYWADSEGFWEYITDRSNYTLEAGKGYVLALDLDLMKDNNTSFWSNDIEQVELFFPSTANVGNITAINVKTSVDSHPCTIDRRTDKNTPDIDKDRTKADAHWNVIGVPSYANYGTTLYSDEVMETSVTWNSSPYTNDLPFLYEWSPVDNTYTAQSGTTYPFKAMHAYIVQYHGDLYWKLASATPPSVAARHTDAPQNVEFRLELQQDDAMIDQTFVKLSDEENVSANFAFDEDLCKEYNARKANIYTFIENYIPAAGNCLPTSTQTTIVPVGVKVVANGDYTFSIPDGTSGMNVTLVDTYTGARTSLGLIDYTTYLTTGTHDGRFLLEIAPVQNVVTEIENAANANANANADVRKVLIDGRLYIVKDGKAYDATGQMVK